MNIVIMAPILMGNNIEAANLLLQDGDGPLKTTVNANRSLIDVSGEIDDPSHSVNGSIYFVNGVCEKADFNFVFDYPPAASEVLKKTMFDLSMSHGEQNCPTTRFLRSNIHKWITDSGMIIELQVNPPTKLGAERIEMIFSLRYFVNEAAYRKTS